MLKQLTNIVPLQAGKFLGFLIGFASFIVMLFLLPALMFSGKAVADVDYFQAVWILLVPACHGVVGFAGGFMAASVYNLVAKWTGGLEVEFRDVPPEEQ